VPRAGNPWGIAGRDDRVGSPRIYRFEMERVPQSGIMKRGFVNSNKFSS